MPAPDQEGYTLDEPLGIAILFDYWDDIDSIMKELTATLLVEADHKTRHAGDKDAEKLKDPMFQGGLRTLFKQTMVLGYKDQVTGNNFDFIAATTRSSIVQKMKASGAVSALTDEQAMAGYSMFLSPLGDYSGQLASAVPGGGFVPNINGDILRLKYVTRGNSVKFTVSLDFLGQLIDPISVFSGGGPAFTVYFDTVTRVDVRLPHRTSDGFQLMSARIEKLNPSVHAENLDGRLVLSSVEGPIANGVSGPPTDIRGQLGPSIAGLADLPADHPFDQVDYLNRGGEVVMRATQHPHRDFVLTIDYVQDLFPGAVEPHIGTQVGIPGTVTELPLDRFPFLHGNHPVGKHFADGTRYVIAEIGISRNFIHTIVGGQLVRLGNDAYIYYDDGTITDLGADFNPSDPASAELLKGLIPKHNPTPPGKTGVVRVLFLHLDYTLASVIGRYNGISIFRGKSGQQIRVPGDKIIPEIWFTVTMEGTRNVPIPNLDPPIPPRDGQTAVYVGGR